MCVAAYILEHPANNSLRITQDEQEYELGLPGSESECESDNRS